MKLIKNTGSDRVIDELRQALVPPSSLALASPAFSLFAFAELRDLLEKLDTCRMVLPEANGNDLGLTGSQNDRAFRNRLQLRWLARECAGWVKKVELRGAPGLLPQSILIAGKPESELQRVITGNCAFTTEGFGHHSRQSIQLDPVLREARGICGPRLVVHGPVEYASRLRSAENRIPRHAFRNSPIRKPRRSSTT